MAKAKGPRNAFRAFSAAQRKLNFNALGVGYPMPRLSYSQMRGMLQEPQLSQMTGLRVSHFLQTQCGWAATAEYDMTPPPAVPRLPMSSSMSMVPAWSLSGSGAPDSERFLRPSGSEVAFVAPWHPFSSLPVEGRR